MKLRLLERCNRCEMEGNTISGNSQPLHRGAGVYPCFHLAFLYVNERCRNKFNNTYRLHMYKRYNGRHNNFTVLSKVNMCRLLNSFKQIIPFKFHFEETENEYILVLNISRGTALQNKALLMLSRSLFEFPHNMCGSDALKLRELGHLGEVDLKDFSLIKLYLLCLSSTKFSWDESFINQDTPTLLPCNILKESLNVVGKKHISTITPYKNYRSAKVGRTATVEAITSEEGFNARKNIYQVNLVANLHA